jgi:hypothetical protein
MYMGLYISLNYVPFDDLAHLPLRENIKIIILIIPKIIQNRDECGPAIFS